MTKRLPPLESLRILEACVRHSSFTRAANEVGLTAAAVSLRIRNLEQELGARLFERSGPHVRPTRSAHVLAARIAETLRDVCSAVSELRSDTQPLRLTATPSFASRWLAPRLARYHQRPGAVPIHVDCSAELRTSGQFDLAIRTGLGDWPSFATRRLMPVESTPMLSPALAATVRLESPADLAKLPLLAHDDWPLWFRQAKVRTPRLRYCADEYPTHELDAAAAIAGAGVALLSPLLFAAAVRDGQLVQPFAVVVRGPNWHFLLSDPAETRPEVHGFGVWLQAELAT
jgi:LysR family transcriptional regulator, glycine cleavage system transcriptional activator